MQILHEVLWKLEQEYNIFLEELRTMPSTCWVGIALMVIGCIISTSQTNSVAYTICNFDFGIDISDIIHAIIFITGIIIMFVGLILCK